MPRAWRPPQVARRRVGHAHELVAGGGNGTSGRKAGIYERWRFRQTSVANGSGGPWEPAHILVDDLLA
jgi:hypothetical protein